MKFRPRFRLRDLMLAVAALCVAVVSGIWLMQTENPVFFLAILASLTTAIGCLLGGELAGTFLSVVLGAFGLALLLLWMGMLR